MNFSAGYTVVLPDMDNGVGTHEDLLLTVRAAHVRRDWHALYATLR
jgi:hypothetical protein